MPFFAFRNTPFQGVYKNFEIYKEIIKYFPEASYRKFHNKEEKNAALRWAKVEQITSTKKYNLLKQKYKSKNPDAFKSKNLKTNEYPVLTVDSYERKKFQINERIQLTPSEYDGYISSSWDSYDISVFKIKELEDLDQCYEIIDGGVNTSIKIYFYIENLDCLHLLLIPDEYKNLFNKRYREHFIDPNKEEGIHIPSEISMLNCIWCHGKGCTECM